MTKISIDTRVHSGLVADIRNAATAIAVWKASDLNSTQLEESMKKLYMGITCSTVIANRGQTWVCEQFRSSSDSTFSPGSPSIESSNHGVAGLHLQRQKNIEAMKRFHSLQVAAYCGDSSVVQVLLQNGADPNAETGSLGHPLYAAAYLGSIDTVTLLLEKGADLHRSGYAGTPLEVATCDGHVEIMRLLLDRGAAVNAHGRPTTRVLLEASRRGHEEAVQLLLDRRYGLDINFRTIINQTPLLLAAQNKHKGVVKLLLECPDIEPNTTDNHGSTLLLWAVTLKWTDIVQILVSMKNLDPNIRDARNNTPLVSATREGQEDIVRLLLDRDDIQHGFGDRNYCPLWLATFHGHAKILGFLLEKYNLKPDDYGHRNSTLLWWAAGPGIRCASTLKSKRREYQFQRSGRDYDPRVGN